MAAWAARIRAASCLTKRKGVAVLVNKKVLSAMTNSLGLGLVPTTPEAIPLIPSVQPVVVVSDKELTGTLIDTSSTIDLFTGVAAYELVPAYTCSPGKRAYIVAVTIGPTTAYKGIIQGLAGSTTDYGPLTGIGDPTEYLFAQPNNQWLNAGRSLGIYSVTPQAADTARTVNYIVIEVDW